MEEILASMSTLVPPYDRCMNDMALPQALCPNDLNPFPRDPLHEALGLPLAAGLSYGELSGFVAQDHPGIVIPESLDRAIASRRHEYRAGRAHASLALRAAGFARQIYPEQDRDRLPAWPTGWLGSISHSGDRVAAVAIGREHVDAVGIDVQERKADPSIVAISPYVAQPHELALLTTLDELTAVLLAFSAKEALYKAIYPHMRRFQDFDAAILRGVTSGALQLELAHDWSGDWRAKALLEVHYAIQPDYIYCACVSWGTSSP